MLPRHFAVATGLFLFAGRLVYAQVDAQDRTQSFFDDHKGADVINSDRVITNTVRRPPTAVQVSALPPLTKDLESKLTKANAKEIARLLSQKKAFVEEQLSKIGGKKAAALDARNLTNLTKQVERDWEKRPAGQKLKRLERTATTGSTLPPLTH